MLSVIVRSFFSNSSMIQQYNAISDTAFCKSFSISIRVPAGLVYRKQLWEAKLSWNCLFEYDPWGVGHMPGPVWASWWSLARRLPAPSRGGCRAAGLLSSACFTTATNNTPPVSNVNQIYIYIYTRERKRELERKRERKQEEVKRGDGTIKIYQFFA